MYSTMTFCPPLSAPAVPSSVGGPEYPEANRVQMCVLMPHVACAHARLRACERDAANLPVLRLGTRPLHAPVLSAQQEMANTARDVTWPE